MSPASQFESEPQLPEPEPTKYELNIGPELSAIVEIDQLPESYFDRRHEVMDKSAEESVAESVKPMVPLTEVLAKYDVKKPAKPPAYAPPLIHVPHQPATTTISYKQHILWGFIPGLVIATLLLILINR